MLGRTWTSISLGSLSGAVLVISDFLAAA